MAKPIDLFDREPVAPHTPYKTVHRVPVRRTDTTKTLSMKGPVTTETYSNTEEETDPVVTTSPILDVATPVVIGPAPVMLGIDGRKAYRLGPDRWKLSGHWSVSGVTDTAGAAQWCLRRST